MALVRRLWKRASLHLAAGVAMGAVWVVSGFVSPVPVYHTGAAYWADLIPQDPITQALPLPPQTAPQALTQSKEATTKRKLSLVQRQRKYWPLVRHISRAHGMDPALVMAVIHQESRFKPRAVSPRGATGLMQIIPATAEELGLEDPTDPKANLKAGITYLARLKKLFDGNLTLALAAYNAGPTKVRELGKVPDHDETQDYVIKVLSKVGYFRARFMALARR